MRTNQQDPISVYILSVILRTWKKRIEVSIKYSTISYFQWVSNVFHISLKFTYVEQYMASHV